MLSQQHLILTQENGHWVKNIGVPESLSPQLKGWTLKTQQRAEAGEINKKFWPIANGAEPNALIAIPNYL
jgi:hypothetical protein